VEEFEPERTTLSLFLEPPELTDEQKSAIVDYLTDNISGTAEDIAEYLDVSLPSVSAELSRMLADDLLVCSDGRYRLKS
jgi:Mn-dependent DtxR family transcriptional regulator